MYKLCRFKNITCGDININLLNPLNLNSITSFIALMVFTSYINVINCPTKYNPITKSSLIDHFWVNFSSAFFHSGVTCEDMSDHFLPFMYLNISNYTKKNYVNLFIFYNHE